MTQLTMMAREIAEQPEGIRRTLDALLPARHALADLAGDRRHVLLVARGTSDNAAVYGRYLLETAAGRPTALAAPSVATHYRTRLPLHDTIVVSISQSGETTEIVETQAWAAACGARTVAITNAGDSALAEAADLALVTRAGDEVAVPATKSHTAQLAAMAVVATGLAPDPTILDRDLARVPEEVQRLLDDPGGVDAAAERLAGASETIVSGRGLCYGAALEVALKLEETCLRPVRGLSYADLRHGPIAVVDAGVVAILVTAADGPMLDGMRALAEDLRRRGAGTVAIGGGPAMAGRCDLALPGPDLPEALAPIGLVVPAQLVVEALARRLGFDPDAPRGLSKVTATDPNR